jgi:AcrR family transcriptional regulator
VPWPLLRPRARVPSFPRLRLRLRTQTLQEIEDAAYAIVDAEGVHALSVAAVARSLAMSAPGIYRYFPSRDALVAHLATRSYQQLTDALGADPEAGRRTPRARVGRLVAAYRDWALQHPRRYGMIFGEPARDLPREVLTRTPLDPAMALLIDLLAAAYGTAPDGTSGDRALDGQLRLWARERMRPDTAPPAARAAILIWTRVHGIVSLELTGMFDDQGVEVRRLIDLEVDDAVRLLAPAPS